MTSTARGNTISEPAPGKSSGAERAAWKTTGWQGANFEAPSEWNVVAYSGDAKNGSLRLDNGEPPSRSALGMELRWSQLKGKFTEADMERRLEQFFAGISKGAKRQKLSAETKKKEIDDARFPEREFMRSFTWRADRRAIGRIWHCTECGRLMIAQVVGGFAGDWSGAASQVLRSLQCHPEEAGWKTWSLYDLLTAVPDGYALAGKPQLMNIYVQLPFVRGMSQDTLSVEQWGAANVQLRGEYLDQWFRQKNAALEGTLSYTAREGTAQGHPALWMTGRRTGIAFWFAQAMPQLARLQMPATHFSACVWECPDSNKVYLVQSLSRKPQPELVRQIVERTQCHF